MQATGLGTQLHAHELPAGDLWVFGYGSLIWEPGFAFAERRLATLAGYCRAFCMTSVHYRGTPEMPGLVLALDRAETGSCAGVAYRVAAPQAPDVLTYLRERELISYAYDEARLPIRLDGDEEVEAVTYVTNRTHPQYRGDLSLEAQAEVIARAVGPRGPNVEYLMNTAAGLKALGINDPDLERLVALVRSVSQT